MNEELERALQAYRDGELRGLAARRLRRRIERDPALRRELEELDRLGEMVRAAEAGRRAPDLLAGLEARLAAVDAELEAGRLAPGEAGAPSPRRRWRDWLAPAPVGALAAAALAAIAFLLLEPGGGGGPSPGAGDIRSLDTRGHAVMVSSDERATIVWILDS